jgi:hypothetical protein
MLPLGADLRAITFVDDRLFGLTPTGQVMAFTDGESIKPIEPDITSPGEIGGDDATDAEKRARIRLLFDSPVLMDQLAVFPNDSSDAPVQPGEISRTISGNRSLAVNEAQAIRGEDGNWFSYVVHVQSRSSATVSMYKSDDGAASARQLAIRVPNFIGSVEIVGVGLDGSVYVAAENFSLREEKGINVGLQINRIDRAGRTIAAMLVTYPPRGVVGGEPAAQGVTLVPNKPNNVSVPILTKRSLTFMTVTLSSVPLADGPSVADTSGDSWPAWDAGTLEQRRKLVLGRAESYLSMEWVVSNTSLREGINATCNPPESQWLRPAFLRTAKVGETVYGAPYKWNGKDAVDRILEQLRQGAIAGNVCCRIFRDPRTQKMVPTDVAGATGVDCSGFVSRTWGLRGTTGELISVGTSDLIRHAATVKRLEDLAPGDALDLPNSHVRLFVGWMSTSRGVLVRAYESTSASMCSGVCMRDLPLRMYIGYLPLGLP